MGRPRRWIGVVRLVPFYRRRGFADNVAIGASLSPAKTSRAAGIVFYRRARNISTALYANVEQGILRLVPPSVNEEPIVSTL